MNKIKKPNAVILKIFIVLSVLNIFLLYLSHYLEAHYQFIYYPNFKYALWFFVIPISIVAAVTALIPTYHEKKLSMLSKIIAVPLLIVVSISCAFSLYHVGDAIVRIMTIDSKRFEIQDITLEEFDKIDDNHISTILYIGRDNCPYCNEVYPLLQSVAQTRPAQIMYYNTLHDRSWRRDDMQAILDAYSVTSVPVVLVVVNGSIEHTIYYEGDAETFDLALNNMLDGYELNNIYFTERQIKLLKY